MNEAATLGLMNPHSGFCASRAFLVALTYPGYHIAIFEPMIIVSVGD